TSGFVRTLPRHQGTCPLVQDLLGYRVGQERPRWTAAPPASGARCRFGADSPRSRTRTVEWAHGTASAIALRCLGQDFGRAVDAQGAADPGSIRARARRAGREEVDRPLRGPLSGEVNPIRRAHRGDGNRESPVNRYTLPRGSE